MSKPSKFSKLFSIISQDIYMARGHLKHSNAEATFVLVHKDNTIFEHHQNPPVTLVFVG